MSKKHEWIDGGLWTQSVVDKAKEVINDDDIDPVVVPSYNRPKNHTLNLLKNSPELKVLVFVRENQADLYRSEWSQYKHIKIVPIKEEVKNLTETRHYINRALSKAGIDRAFVLDDDIFNLYYLVPGQKKDGGYKGLRTLMNPTDFFKAWQYSMGHVYTNDEWGVSGINPGNCAHFYDVRLPSIQYREVGLAMQIVYINIENIMRNNVNYDIVQQSWEDFLFCLDCLDNGLDSVLFKWLSYDTVTLASGTGGVDYADSYAKRASEYMYSKWGDHYVRLVFKKNICNARVYWQRCRKDFLKYGTLPNKRNSIPDWSNAKKS